MSVDLFAAEAAITVRVAVPIPVKSPLDYAVPEHLESKTLIGRRVRVEVGRRQVVGVVIGEAALSPSGLRPLLEVLDQEPVIDDKLISVLLEQAEHIGCPPGIAMESALPAGSIPRVAYAYELSNRGLTALATSVATGQLKTLLQALSEKPVKISALKYDFSASTIEAAVRERLIKQVEVHVKPRANIRLEDWVKVDDRRTVEEARAQLIRSPRQAQLFEELKNSGPTPAKKIRSHTPNARALRELQRRGLVCIEHRKSERKILGDPPIRDQVPNLSQEQSEAVEVITLAVKAKSNETFLLHGVTGSGKTEVYLRAIATALEEKRSALVLVPEITLTHQIVHRLRARFGELVAILHSGLSESERFEQWKKLKSGAVPIAVGARSALFAPLNNVGLIVIDEEHDSAYKNAEGFRYHAHDIATSRGRVDNCPIILGSATPSLETRYSSESDQITRLTLPYRIGRRPMPSVRFIDLVKEQASAPRGKKLILSPPLLKALSGVLQEGGQTILFLNRRGFATQISCFMCGYVERCQNCDISLVFHAHEQVLRCHYCDYRTTPREVCQGCGKGQGSLLGIGTERVEEAVREEFPTARIGRLDRDTANRKGATQTILDDLRDHQLDILIGTQMVAKGHDFPGVTLVGVIHADQALHFPDFRAAERCFQLLTQVAGRAGRSEEPGQVLIQTYDPEHYAMKPALSHDYETFYRQEIVSRRELFYPPFCLLVQIGISSSDLGETEKAAEHLAHACRRNANGDIAVLGPAPAPIARLRGKHRMQLLLKASKHQDLLTLTQRVKSDSADLPKTVRITYEFNPTDML